MIRKALCTLLSLPALFLGCDDGRNNSDPKPIDKTGTNPSPVLVRPANCLEIDNMGYIYTAHYNGNGLSGVLFVTCQNADGTYSLYSRGDYNGSGQRIGNPKDDRGWTEIERVR